MNKFIGKWWIGIFLLASLPSLYAENLYKGEEIKRAAGFPAISKFVAGNPEKPLIVFVPGAHHTARVFYGGHEGYRKDDFVAYWLNQKGYNVLALSYPIATKGKAIKTNHPDFKIRDWGKQVAALTDDTVQKHNLSNQVIVVGWSMGGKIVQSVHEAMVKKHKNLNLDFYVALTATPPIPGLIVLTKKFPMLKDSGYANRRDKYKGWYQQIAAQGQANGHSIVSKSVYDKDYVGDIAINLQGYGEQYRKGKFVMDQLATQDDGQPFNFGNFPLIGVIAPDGRGDRRHALTDKGAWGIYNVNTIYKRYLSANKIDVKTLSDAQWEELLHIARNIDDELFMSVNGNHFFFMGRKGASLTADAIEKLQIRVSSVKRRLSHVLGVQIE